MKQITVLIVAIALTLTSATMTVAGYLSLYQESSIIIASLFIILEIAKATIFGIVLVHHKLNHQRLPLAILVAILIVISFLGHLSFLSNSYASNKIEVASHENITTALQSSSQSQISIINQQIEAIQNEINQYNNELETINQNISSYKSPNSKNWVYTTNKKRIQEITEHNKTLYDKLQQLYSQQSEINSQLLTQTEKQNNINKEISSRSVFIYTADIFSVTPDHLANIINIILAIVVDTLALIMLWTATTMWEQAAKDKTLSIKKNGVQFKEGKPVQKAKHEITLSNCKKYTFNGVTVDEIINMNTQQLTQLKAQLKSEDALNWFNAAMTLRNHATIRGTLSEDIYKYEELQ